MSATRARPSGIVSGVNGHLDEMRPAIGTEAEGEIVVARALHVRDGDVVLLGRHGLVPGAVVVMA